MTTPSPRSVLGSGATESIRASGTVSSSSSIAPSRQSGASTVAAGPAGNSVGRVGVTAGVVSGGVFGVSGAGNGPMSFNPTSPIVTTGNPGSGRSKTAAPIVVPNHSAPAVGPAAVSAAAARNDDSSVTSSAITTANTTTTNTPTPAGNLSGGQQQQQNNYARPPTSPFNTTHAAMSYEQQILQRQSSAPQILAGGVGPSANVPQPLPVSAGPTHRARNSSGSIVFGGAGARYEQLLDDATSGGSMRVLSPRGVAAAAARSPLTAAATVGGAVNLAMNNNNINEGVPVGGKAGASVVPGGGVNEKAIPVGGIPLGSVSSPIPLALPVKQLGPPVLTLKNISKSFAVDGGNEVIHALHSISLCEPDQADGFSFPAIRQGEFVMIRGPSGGGKTTLLNMVGTIDAPTKGSIELMGEKITKESPDAYLADLRLRRIGFVFQTFNLLPTMSALENVELPMTLVGKLNEQEQRSRAKQLLALVGLRNRVHHLPSELSGGEQQRVTIARALANNPDLLLLDEPTGDLDTATTIQVMDLLLQINCMSGTTCIMVTHNPDVECYADRILYVADGRFVRQAVNTRPVPLVRDDYEEYLKEMERKQTQLMLNRNQDGNVKPTATNMASVEF